VGRLFHGASVIPAARVARIDPWEETVRLRRRERRGRAQAARAGGAIAAGVVLGARRLALYVREGARVAAKLARHGAILLLALLAAAWALVVALARLARRHAPGARRRLGAATAKTAAVAGASAAAAARLARDQSKALSARAAAARQARNAPPEALPAPETGDGAAPEASENGAVPTSTPTPPQLPRGG
jgi:hypothetical protein